MDKSMPPRRVSSEIEVTLHMIGGKFKPLILYALCEHSPKRFSELQRFLQNASQKTLTNQLRELSRDGLVTRTVFAEVPPRVEYSVTEKGMTLLPLLEHMCAWGEKNMDGRFILTNPQCENE